MSTRFELQSLSGPLDRVRLVDTQAGTLAEVAPARGGLVTRWQVGGRERLYLDESTLLDPSKNVRGGIPLLFPTPGKLEGDAWSRAGRQGALPQHGFARNESWSAIEASTVDAARVRLRLTDSEATRAKFPWPFELTLDIALVAESLTLSFALTNTGREPLPYGLGTHPYFALPVEEKAQARIPTAATLAWDNAAKRAVAFPGWHLGEGETDLHLEDHGRSSAELLAASNSVRIECDGALQRWVIWTQPGKPFICLEPWSCAGNALNTGAGLITLEPGTTASHRMRFLGL